ncbi:MAG TPA: diacylglycerol kinase family protein [Candidatus Deferrimicrobiaceae bacterium]|nr:diacylglycerol kinase family protein [Candidatus Deferrimicrobiaceae bacterium]
MIRVIYNPVAGPRMVRKIDRVREILSAGKIPFEIRETAGPGDAVILAREAAHVGMDAAVAVGGDGTVNEVVNGLAGTATRLLVVPHGTGNVFAAEVGLPGSVEGCLSLLSAGKTIAVRLAIAEERHFLLLASAGFDAEVLARMGARGKHYLGIGAYFLAGAVHLLREQPSLWMEMPGKERVEAQAVIICRGKKYGGGVIMAPSGNLEGDTLQVVALRKLGRWPILKFTWNVLRGKHAGSPDVLIQETPSVFVRSRIPSAAQVDGDYLGPLPVRFTMTDAVVRIVVPVAYAKEKPASGSPG